jgi:hypothetical protein
MLSCEGHQLQAASRRWHWVQPAHPSFRSPSLLSQLVWLRRRLWLVRKPRFGPGSIPERMGHARFLLSRQRSCGSVSQMESAAGNDW